MDKILRFVFIGLLLFFSYHFVRDVLQIFGVQNYFIDIWHREHVWCKSYCRYVTLAPEIFNIVAIGVILKRSRVGILGVIVLLLIPVWLLMWFVN